MARQTTYTGVPSPVLRGYENPGLASPGMLVDASGRPLRASDEDLAESMLGSYDSYQAAAFIFPPYNPDAFIVSKGYQVLDDMLNIIPLKNALNTRRDAVLSRGWSFTPQIDGKDALKDDPEYDQAQKLADLLTWCLENIEDDSGNCQDFRDVLYELLYADHVGFAVSEIVWKHLADAPKELKGKLGFKVFAAKPAQQIGFQLDLKTLNVLGITSYSPLQGYQFNLPVDKVLRYTYSPRANLPYGRGIGRAAYMHSWSIAALVKFWNIGLECFGQPFMMGTAPPGKAMELARKAFTQIRRGSPAVVPEGIKAELMEIQGTGLAGFSAAVSWHAEQCSLAYLGATLTAGTASGGGTNTNALGNVHADQQSYAFSADRKSLEFIGTTQIARRWVKYNFGPQMMRLCPRLSLGDTKTEDLKANTAATKTAIDVGSAHPDEPVVRAKFGLPPIDPAVRKQLNDEKAQRQAEKAEQAKQNLKTSKEDNEYDGNS